MKNCLVLLRVLWFPSSFWAGSFANKNRTDVKLGQFAHCFGSMTWESR